MSVEMIAATGSIFAILAILFAGHRWLVKAYLKELVPNHGSSLADRVTRIEQRVDMIYDHLITTR